MRVFVLPGAVRMRVLWLALSAAALVGGIAFLPGADGGSFLGGVPEVQAASAPNLMWLSARQTPAISLIKGNATVGTPAGSGPSANIGQTIQIKGGALGPGSAGFAAYNGGRVTAPLVSVKPGKKGKVAVPPTAVSGGVSVIPDGGSETTTLPLQIVPTIDSLTPTTVTAGATLTINGTGFTPTVTIAIPGVAGRVSPSQVDADSMMVTVPAGVQKGKVSVFTDGGQSNTKKLKISAGLANRSLATDPLTGLILATNDVENTLSAIDPASGRTLRSVAISPDAEWIAVVDGTRTLAVGDENGVIGFVDIDTFSTANAPAEKSGGLRSDELSLDRGRVVVDGTPVDVGQTVELARRTPDGRFAVALAGDAGRLVVIDVATRSVSAVRAFDGPIEGVTFGLDGRVYTIDRESGQLLSAPIE